MICRAGQHDDNRSPLANRLASLSREQREKLRESVFAKKSTGNALVAEALQCRVTLSLVVRREHRMV